MNIARTRLIAWGLATAMTVMVPAVAFADYASDLAAAQSDDKLTLDELKELAQAYPEQAGDIAKKAQDAGFSDAAIRTISQTAKQANPSLASNIESSVRANTGVSSSGGGLNNAGPRSSDTPGLNTPNSTVPTGSGSASEEPPIIGGPNCNAASCS